jgi:CRP-like cAMP-binding protein
MSVLGGQPRSATVVVGETGLRALVLSAADFQEILLNQPEIGLELLGVLSQRLAEAKS